MEFIVNLAGKIIALYDVEQKKVVALIENDYGLIRHILKILRSYELSTTKDGYLLFENKIGEVYLHRIIMEYYSRFNNKLFTILSNTSEYEVNHKNKNKWDNRLENLEVVTKYGNKLHEKGKEYSSEIVFSTEELLKIRQDNLKEKDRKYLEKVSSLNVKLLQRVDWDSKYKLCDSLYIRFNNKTVHTIQTSINTISINTLESFNNIILLYLKNTFSNINTYNIVRMYDEYRCNNIIKQNLKIIFKYMDKSNSFRDVLKKYKLINQMYIKEKDLNNGMVKLDLDINGVSLSNNILIDLFCYSIKPLQITFYKNHLFLSVSVKDISITVGKYKSFKVLYLLGLLKRQRVPVRNKQNYINKSTSVSAFLIPEYTEDLFTSTVIPLAKEVKEMDLSKITYTIIARNFNFEIADLVYKNPKLKSKAVSDFITIDDVLDILSSSSIYEKVLDFGFITSNDVRHELQLLNEEREERGLPFRKIVDSDVKFVTSILRNVTEIKSLLNELGLEYTKLNLETIQKIKKYQKNNGIENIPLALNQTKIVKKDLIVRNKKKES